jgi:uncharacterized protein
LLVVAALLAACDRADPPPAAETREAAPPLKAASTATPPAFPALTGRVVDEAGLLSPEQEARLTERLAALEDRTTDQLVVVTVPSLRGRTTEEYAPALANHWGIGQEDQDNGVLLLVAPQERQVRIAVGYGLTPILTNARSDEIIQRDLLPAFRQRRWNEGIFAGVDSIVQTLVTHADEPRRGR